MDPIRLQKQLRDNTNDLQNCFEDIQKWGAEMKRKEETKRAETKKMVEVEVPPSCNKPNKAKKIKSEEVKSEKTEGSSKVPKDYNYWAKFNVDAECEKIDKEKSDSESDLSDEIDEGQIEAANIEKDKGNKFVKVGRYEDAVKCYTNAIDAYAYEPIFYANRALCHLKLKRHRSAEADCTTALQIDDSYVKAFHRRATAREALGQFNEAKADLEKVLEIEPNNKESKEFLHRIISKLASSDIKNEVTTQRPVSKFTLSRQKAKGGPVEPEWGHKDAIQDKIVEKKRPELAVIESKQITSNPKAENKLEVIRKKDEDYKNEISLLWPAGDSVISVACIDKSVKERSKKRLKRMKVYDVDVKTEIKLDKLNIQPEVKQESTTQALKTNTDGFKIAATACDTKPDNKSKFDNLDYNVDTSNINFSPLNVAVPTTTVQFSQNWKSFKDNELKYLYLRQINPTLYTAIFKDSMDSKAFSEIIEILADKFVEKSVPVFEYLYGITKVKRFSAMVMFKSGKDKNALLKLIDSMREDTRRTKEEVDYLIKKYEM